MRNIYEEHLSEYSRRWFTEEKVSKVACVDGGLYKKREKRNRFRWKK